jgi:segregation and condensation protein A
MERMKSERDVDLITAGRIILMAWSVLKLQSDDVLYRAEHDAQEEEEEYLPDPEGDWYTDEASYEFTRQMIQPRTPPPIRELVWRKGKRPVTLLELVSAFEEAKKESELQQELAVRRREMKRREMRMRRALVGKNYHKEDLEADISLTWARINQHNGHPIPLSGLICGGIDDRLTTFISTLFLAKNRKVDLWQEKFPYGEIFVKNLAPTNLDAGPLVEGAFGTGDGRDSAGKGNGGNGKGDNGDEGPGCGGKDNGGDGNKGDGQA